MKRKMTSLRSELKGIILQTCQQNNDDVYQRWMKFCGRPTHDSLPEELKVPFTAMRIRVMVSALDKEDECWRKVVKGWNDQEEIVGEFGGILDQAV